MAQTQTDSREALNRVLRTLSDSGAVPFDRLLLDCGLDAPLVATAIHHAKKSGYIDTRSSNGAHNGKTLYAITELGGKVAPPKFVIDLARYEPPKDVGARHVHGLKGKFNYSKPLRGALATLYDALTKPMTVEQWSRAANMQPNAMYAYIKKLSKLEIIGYHEEKNPATGRTNRVYARSKDMQTENMLPLPEPEQGSVVEQGDIPIGPPAPMPAPPAPYVSHFSKPAIPLEEGVDELAQHYSPFEICLAALALLEDDYKDLKAFHAHIKKTYNGG